MYSLELSSEQIKARKGWITVWEAKGRVSRVAFELKAPKDTPTKAVLSAISLQKFGTKLFRGFEDREARIEFTNLGSVLRIVAIK